MRLRQSAIGAAAIAGLVFGYGLSPATAQPGALVSLSKCFAPRTIVATDEVRIKQLGSDFQGVKPAFAIVKADDKQPNAPVKTEAGPDAPDTSANSRSAGAADQEIGKALDRESEFEVDELKLISGALKVIVDGREFMLWANQQEEPILLTFDEKQKVKYAKSNGQEAVSLVRLDENKAVALDRAKVPPVLPLTRDGDFSVVYNAFAPPRAEVQVGRVAGELPKAESVEVCLAKVGEGEPRKVSAYSVKRGGEASDQDDETEVVTVSANFPRTMLDWYDRWPWHRFNVALADKDNRIFGYAHTWVVTPAWAVLMSLIVVLAAFHWLGYSLARRRFHGGATDTPKTQRPANNQVKPARGGRKFANWFFLQPLYVGAEGVLSISLMQITLWTVVAVWAIVYVFLRSWDLLAMTTQVMGLLGFAGATAVTARIIAGNRRPFRREGKDNEIVAGTPELTIAAADNARFSELVQGGDKKFDLVKLQLLIFTLLIAGFVVYRVLEQGAFPDLDTNFLLLMGVSNGVYLGNKFSGDSAVSQLEILQNRKMALDAQFEQRDEKRQELEERKAELIAKIDKDLNAQVQEIERQIADTAEQAAEKRQVLEQQKTKLLADVAEVGEDTEAGKVLKAQVEEIERQIAESTEENEEKRQELEKRKAALLKDGTETGQELKKQAAKIDDELAELVGGTDQVDSIEWLKAERTKIEEDLKRITDILAGKDPDADK